MPWTINDVERHKKGLTPPQKKKWVKIANGALKDCQDKGGSDCEGKAIRIANSKFSDEGEQSTIWALDDLVAHDEYFDKLKTDPKDRPGGSNVGKYDKGPFCGPSGGTPSGTYPVNTRKRAIAAIAYARHAPNPSGIKACVCRHWSDLPACKKGKQSEMSEVLKDGMAPSSALCLTEACCFAESDEGGTEVTIVGYSGNVIPNHWYWGNLGIDLEGMKFPQNRYPVLENHNIDKKIGFTDKPDAKKMLALNRLQFDNDTSITLLDTEEAKTFQKNSKQGFPYQASIYAVPTKIERLAPGTKAKVNEHEIQGPGHIWRESVFKEVSVCVFGHDSLTRSHAMSEELVQIPAELIGFSQDAETIFVNDNKEGGEKPMTPEEFKEQFPDEYQKLVDEITTEANKQFQKKEGELKDSVASLTSKVEDLTTQFKEVQDENLKLRKNETIRSEKERKDRAMEIFTERLKKSKIPEYLHDKVAVMVDYTQFVENEVLDEEKFIEAVDNEIKDWEGRGVTASVRGASFSKKEEKDDNTPEDGLSDDDWADEMTKMSGQVSDSEDKKGDGYTPVH